jgi:hypothetical protein
MSRPPCHPSEENPELASTGVGSRSSKDLAVDPHRSHHLWISAYTSLDWKGPQ